MLTLHFFLFLSIVQYFQVEAKCPPEFTPSECADLLDNNDLNECEPGEKCPQMRCSADRVLSTYGVDCPLSCQNDPELAETEHCTKNCYRYCICKDGLVNLGFHCIPEPECEGKNEAFVVCGSACQPNCDNYMYGIIPCTKNCISGCQCKDGYVLDKNKNCILPEFCPFLE